LILMGDQLGAARQSTGSAGVGEDRLETGKQGNTEQDDHLDELADRYENIAKFGDHAGFRKASHHLRKFLRGDNSREKVDSKWLRGYDVVDKTVESNQNKLGQKLFANFE